MHEETGFVEKLGFWASIAGNSMFRSPQPRSKAGMDPVQETLNSPLILCTDYRGANCFFSINLSVRVAWRSHSWPSAPAPGRSHPDGDRPKSSDRIIGDRLDILCAVSLPRSQETHRLSGEPTQRCCFSSFNSV